MATALVERWAQAPQFTFVAQIRESHSGGLTHARVPNVECGLASALLEPKDVNRVLQVPVFGCGEEDKLIWAFSPNGVYSVKSGYRVCREQIAPASHLTVEGNWKGLWSLGVAPRVKACVWRACRDVLPTRTRLQTKGVSITKK